METVPAVGAAASREESLTILKISVLSVIIVQYNHTHLTVKAIESFRTIYRGAHELIVVDNGSTTPFESPGDGVVVLRNPSNAGFAAANNRAAAQARGDILLFLNNDTVTTGDFVTPVLREFDADPALGVVGPMLVNSDGTFQLSSGLLPTVRVECVDKVLYNLLRRRWGPAMRYAERARRGRTVQWVTGAALFIRSDFFRQLGGFDERFFMFFEDKDLCARALRKGYKVKYVPTPSLTHLGGGSSGARREEIERIYRQSQIVYYEKHRPKVEQAFMKFYLRLAGKAPAE